MSQHSVIFWNIQRVFGSQGSPIEHALSGGEAAPADTSKKITVIAAVIDQISRQCGPPLLIGFAEIENVDLCQRIAENLSTADMQAVEFIREDDTGFALDGLDIGLLVNKTAIVGVSKLRSHVIDRKFITRDILECDLQLSNGKELSVLINHWPSRMVSEAADQRISAAIYTNNLIRAKARFTLQEMWDPETKSLTVPSDADISKRALAPIVVMGDFNDEMFDKSIELLGSTNDTEVVLADEKVRGNTKKARFQSYMKHSPAIFNPFWQHIGGVGSYYRTPRWRFYDQIMMSKGLLDSSFKPFYLTGSATIFNERTTQLQDGSTFEVTNKNGKPIPFDKEKQRGCSDHFPVVISIEL
jgi:hypothetical protein